MHFRSMTKDSAAASTRLEAYLFMALRNNTMFTSGAGVL